MTTDTRSASPRRMTLRSTNPKVYKALVGLQMAAAADFDADLVELIKIRASQINGCAYCLHMHVSDATAMGIDGLKMHMVSVWREARNFFTDREQAVLEFTEDVTRLGEHGVSDDVWTRVSAHFDAVAVGQLLANVLMINLWNRVAIVCRYPAGSDERSV